MAKRNTYFQNEVIEKKIDVKQLGRILKYVLPYQKIFSLVGVLMLVAACTSLISPLLLRYIINHVVEEKDYRQLALVISGLVLLAAIEIVITYFQQTLMGKVGHNIIADIRKEIFYKLQELPFEYFDNRPNGKIVVRVTDYINDLANFFTNYVLLFLVYCVKIVVVSFFMLGISPKLTAIVFATVLPLMFCVFFLRYKIRKRFSLHRARVSNRTAFLVETIMGEKIVKNYNRVEKNSEIYKDIHDISIRTWWKIVLLNELNTPIVESFWNLGMLCLYGISLALILQGDASIDAGTVVAFTSYMGLFSGPLTQIAAIIQNLSSVTSNLEQVFDTIDTPVQINDSENSEELTEVKGRVDFNHVTFAYDPGVNILENFELHVRPGETIALVGPTGAGKTTIVKLLMRFYELNKGSIMIDGHDIKDFSRHDLRSLFGMVLQDTWLFNGTIKENLMYGKLDASDEEVKNACEMAYVDHFVNTLEDGYDTVLDEETSNISQGQKQLLTIARAFLKDPKILILDEATSSVDTRTEVLIQKGMEKLMEGRTSFVIAHRLSTIRDANTIIVMKDGDIVEIGNHDELLEKGGFYASLYQSQFEGSEI